MNDEEEEEADKEEEHHQVMARMGAPRVHAAGRHRRGKLLLELPLLG